jgi:hypothetical protein
MRRPRRGLRAARIAPRDVATGSEWDQAILRAIESCPAFLPLLSAKANDSPFVKNEVNRAFSQRKSIFRFHVEGVLPSGLLEFYLARQQVCLIGGDRRATLFASPKHAAWALSPALNACWSVDRRCPAHDAGARGGAPLFVPE